MERIAAPASNVVGAPTGKTVSGLSHSGANFTGEDAVWIGKSGHRPAKDRLEPVSALLDLNLLVVFRQPDQGPMRHRVGADIDHAIPAKFEEFIDGQ